MNGKKSRLRRMKLMVSLVAAVSAVIGMTAFGVSSAFAGENGQEINVCWKFSNSISATAVTVIGRNQNVEETVWKSELPNSRGCMITAGYFWVGIVTFFWKDSTGKVGRVTECDVPESSPSNTVNCIATDR